MALKDCIFDSSAERKLFTHLKSIWQDKFCIFPQLPFTKIFNIKELNLNKIEREFLLKTNIDYTICNKDGKPIMCIEFDGLGCGYSKKDKYIIQKNPPKFIEDKEKRRKKLELKLKIATEHELPFYIISFDEIKQIKESIHLMIIDSIIGQTIAEVEFHHLNLNEYLERYRSSLESTSESQLFDYIDFLITSAHMDLELTWDPVAKRSMEILMALVSEGITGALTYSFQFLTKPELPSFIEIIEENTSDIDKAINKWINAWENIRKVGCKIWFKTPKGMVTETVWVRNFEGMFISPERIAQNIAELLAFYKAAILNGIRI